VSYSGTAIAASAGGGLVNGGALTLTDDAITHNSTAGSGGGVYNPGSVILIDSTLSAISAGDGGGLYNLGSMVVTDKTLSGNSAGFGGGGGLFNGGFAGQATITDSTISGNFATRAGGIEFNPVGTLAFVRLFGTISTTYSPSRERTITDRLA
jgi:hypothetical protein